MHQCRSHAWIADCQLGSGWCSKLTTRVQPRPCLWFVSGTVSISSSLHRSTLTTLSVNSNPSSSYAHSTTTAFSAFVVRWDIEKGLRRLGSRRFFLSLPTDNFLCFKVLIFLISHDSLKQYMTSLVVTFFTRFCCVILSKEYSARILHSQDDDEYTKIKSREFDVTS